MHARIIAVVAAAAALLGLAGCAQPDLPWSALDAKYANSQSRFADLSGEVKVHYRDEGPRDAPPIVLVHGFAASLHAWEPWVQRLSGEYRVISLDLPGHGLTRTPPGFRGGLDRNVQVVDELTTKLGVKTFVLGGNSMGGGVSWAYAMKHPDRVRALVLVDSVGLPRPRKGDGPPAVFMLLSNPAGRAVLKSIDITGLAQRGLKSAYVEPSLVTPELVARYVDMSRAPGHKDVLLTMQSAPRAPVTPADFAALKMPTLVMVGTQDKVIPAQAGRDLAKAIPGAKLVEYPTGGHVPMEQLPDASAADLKAFLTALPKPAASPE